MIENLVWIFKIIGMLKNTIMKIHKNYHIVLEKKIDIFGTTICKMLPRIVSFSDLSANLG